MAAGLRYYSGDKRIVFQPGKQRQFLLDAANKLHLSPSSLAKKLSVHQRTMSDWCRETSTLPRKVFNRLILETQQSSPKNIEIRRAYWSTNKAAAIAGKNVYKKYGYIGGDPEIRKRRWQEWWQREGRLKSDICQPKPIRLPRRSGDLAEFVGIMMGDGGMSQAQITISLGTKTDGPYSKYVERLIEYLFSVKPSRYDRPTSGVVALVVSRKKMVDFCQSIGLKLGNKLAGDLDIPDWIKLSHTFHTRCLRGLIDTDGCIYNECHTINGKRYCYPRIAFVSASTRLLSSVHLILQKLGLAAKIRNQRSVNIESRSAIDKYFLLIGTSNPKHRSRYERFNGGVG